MAPTRLALPLLACLFLAGCSLGGGESSDGTDKSEYDGGVGFALSIHNAAEDPFDVTLRVVGVGDKELGRIEETIHPGATIEKWWSLEERSTYSARLNYVWTGAGTSHGQDEQVFHSNDCPEVSRLSWELRQADNVVGSAFLGKTCVSQE